MAEKPCSYFSGTTDGFLFLGLGLHPAGLWHLWRKAQLLRKRGPNRSHSISSSFQGVAVKFGWAKPPFGAFCFYPDRQARHHASSPGMEISPRAPSQTHVLNCGLLPPSPPSPAQARQAVEGISEGCQVDWAVLSEVCREESGGKKNTRAACQFFNLR